MTNLATTMIFGKANIQEIRTLTELRIVYLREDLGETKAADVELIKLFLSGHYEKILTRI